MKEGINQEEKNKLGEFINLKITDLVVKNPDRSDKDIKISIKRILAKLLQLEIFIVF